MDTLLRPQSNTHQYRWILGVRFFIDDAAHAVEAAARGGLVVVPAAPALVTLERDWGYRQALQSADLVLTDSGYMVLLWRVIMRDPIQRVSGLEYLDLLLQRPEFMTAGSAFWVMPSKRSMERNIAWLSDAGYPIFPEDCYVAPKYDADAVSDPHLAGIIDERRPQHVIIGVGGGIQEKLGLYLKQQCLTHPSIHCIGAAIGFLNGDQVRIPTWADRLFLGWLFRCLSNPRRFVPRYIYALQLTSMLWRYGSRMPEFKGTGH